jgi:pimeloyl-ACP methyl ester carboxylesterase
MSSAPAEIAVQRFERNGMTLVGDVAGPADGQPVILLHGGGQTRQSWGGALKEGARRGYRMLTLDSRGHGDSDWHPEGLYGREDQVEDVALVASTLRAPPVLVGASMGGMISLIYAGEHRPLRALVLVDSAPQVEPAGVERITAFMRSAPDGFASLEEAADAVASYLPHRPRPKDNRGLMKNLRRRENGRLYWHWDPRLLSPDRGSRDMSFLRDAARRVQVPALLIRGRESDVVSPEGVQDFLQLTPHAEFVDIAGADHMVAGDRNDAFNAAVFDFLRKLG